MTKNYFKLIFKYFNFVKFILLNDKEYEIIDENLN